MLPLTLERHEPFLRGRYPATAERARRRATVRSIHLLVVSSLVGCAAGTDDATRLVTTEANVALVEAALEDLDGFEVIVSADPMAARSGRDVALVAADSCDGCYRIELEGEGLVIEGGPRGGLVYGLTAMLEGMGYAFPHPTHTIVPETPTWPPTVDGRMHAPEIELRGLHLHTLHPVESLEPAWLPGEENRARMRAIVRWIARHRGNFVRWVGIDDVQTGVADVEAWQAHTRANVEYAHALQMETALVIQLFGSGNLQRAFDLVDDTEASDEAIDAEMRRRLRLLAPVGFDQIGISFGEFFSEDPERFVSVLSHAATLVREEVPGVEVTATVHVGDSEEQRVVYMGEEMIYYFLAQFAPVLPYVHTVMYYALDDDAGGVYHHEDFAEHLGLILERMAGGERVVYFPETAYWVAWDNSIPVYLPLYAKTRHHDLALLDEAPGELYGHVLFSSGWEWGFWQNDLVALRSSYELPPRWVDTLRPYHDAATLDLVEALADLQDEALIDGRLAPYLASRDSVIELGFTMGILGQPDRVEADRLVTGDAAASAFMRDQLPGLRDLADRARALADALAVPDDSLGAELRDGFEVFALRARFVVQLYEAALGSTSSDAAHATMESARGVVARRHAALHWSDPEAILARRRPLPILYRYGYLREADALCFWDRELAKLDNALRGESRTVPLCVL